MDPQNCYICNASTVFYSRNLFKTKSKYSETRICEFIRRFLGNYPSQREFISNDSNENEHCVCNECLNKIDEYDLARENFQRMEKELRAILLHTEDLFYKENKPSINTDELFGSPIEIVETLDDYKVECYEENGHNEIIGLKSSIENYKVESESDEDYIPPGSKKPPQKLVTKIRMPTSLPKVQQRYHKCLKCNMEFKSVAALARHKHTKLDTNKSEHKPIIYSCTNCSEVFCTKTQYEHHLKQHKEEEEQFKCMICSFDLKEKTALEEHTKLHDGLSPLQCVLCPPKKTFKQKGALVRHMRIHSGLHFYQCHRCGKGFIHKSSFEMHLMAHDDIRKKKCPHCSQCFRSTSHLNRHLRIHTGSKPFSCPVCGQKFAQRYNMSVHQRLHDTSLNRRKSEKTHVCNFCNSAFARHSKLEEHLKKNHEAVIPHTAIGNHLDDVNEI